MDYAAILAGGSGVRMGNPDKPKQFYMLGNKPILAHTVEKFCVSGLFEKIIVLAPAVWVQQTKDLLRRYCPEFESLTVVVAGGKERNDTILNAIAYIKENLTFDESTVLVTHDAVRPFVTHRIIKENVDAAHEFGACDTVIPATDTIVESKDNTALSSIPERRFLYQGQTPQSFVLEKLDSLIRSLTDEERGILTDACKIFVLRGENVVLVKGEVANTKITYPQDMRVARALLGEDRA